MARLREQATAITNVCKTALAGKTKAQHGIDNQTIAVAQTILKEAKSMLPDDKVLAGVNLEPPVHFWTSVQTAMEIVASSLPGEKEIGLTERMMQARERVAKMTPE